MGTGKEGKVRQNCVMGKQRKGNGVMPAEGGNEGGRLKEGMRGEGGGCERE